MVFLDRTGKAVGGLRRFKKISGRGGGLGDLDRDIVQVRDVSAQCFKTCPRIDKALDKARVPGVVPDCNCVLIVAMSA